MKRLLLYLVVAIVVVCCGVSIYYVVRNDEKIYATHSETESVYLNVDETVDIPVIHEKPNKNTTLEAVVSSDIAEIDVDNWTITAKSAGETKITITSSNKNFGPFNVLLKIGNGSVEFPYYVRTEEDLRAIGKGKRSLSSNYQLVKDITITETFEPIGTKEVPFSGTLNGMLYGSEVKRLSISNLVIDESSVENPAPVGLFRVISETGKVENIIFKNPKIKANASVAGVIAGKNYGVIGKCEIVNAELKNAKTDSSYTGLVCGLNETKSNYARVSLNTVKGSLEANYVVGGLVGFNKGGVITNNYIEIYGAKVVSTSENKGLFGGLAGQSNDGDAQPYQSVVFNNLALINSLTVENVYAGGAFGIIEANANFGNERRGYYSMLLYNTPLRLSPVGFDFNEVEKINKDLNNEDEIYLNEVELSSEKENARNYSASITNAELNTKSTYTPKGFLSSWDFTNIWSISNGKEIFINYANENLEYQSLPALGTVIEITDNKTLANAISNMVNYPTAKITYLIKGKSETVEVKDENGNAKLDENGEPVVEKVDKKYSYTASVWVPIGTKQEPFAGTIIAEDDAIIEIKKLSLSGREYCGLFGAISNDAVISNIVVTGANLSGTMVGGIVAYQNGGVIKNCIVKNTKISSTKYAGSICGFSTGTIENCYGEKNKIVVNDEQEKNIYLGGIVGKSKGKIISNSINNFDIDIVEIIGKENTICMGGISGFIQNASVSECKCVGISINSYDYKGRTYAGGVIGYSIDSNIKKTGIVVDENKSNVIDVNDSNAYSIAGGLIALMDGGILSKSSTGSITLSSYNSAGLVSFVTGEIESCYSGITTIVKGQYAAGLVCNLYGSIRNSYSLAELCASEIEAGLVTYLWKGSCVENCFTYCSFKGMGKAYVDTSSNYKSRAKDFGSMENCLFVGNNNQTLARKGIKDFYKESIVCRDGSKKAEVQITYLFIAGKYNFITEDELIGKDAYSMFVKLKFNSKQWSYDPAITEDFISPILVDCFDSEFGIIEQQKVEEENEIEESGSGEENIEAENVEGQVAA